MLPTGTSAKIDKSSYPVPAIFNLMQQEGKVEERMMYNTYNMGLGMVLATDPVDADATVAAINAAGEKAYIVGEVISGDKGVELYDA